MLYYKVCDILYHFLRWLLQLSCVLTRYHLAGVCVVPFHLPSLKTLPKFKNLSRAMQCSEHDICDATGAVFKGNACGMLEQQCWFLQVGNLEGRKSVHRKISPQKIQWKWK